MLMTQIIMSAIHYDVVLWDSMQMCMQPGCDCVGTITLLDEDKILWSLFVDHQLFALTKLDVTVGTSLVVNF